MARIVSFCNNKGGVAKTTTVIAMAEAWGDDGLKFRVDLPDFDYTTTQKQMYLRRL